MIRTTNAAENNLFAEPPNVITVAANTATEVFPSEQNMGTEEIAYRYIQNTGANPLYYAFGTGIASTGAPACDNLKLYHGYLPQYSQLDCSNHKLRVCVFSVTGTTVSTTIIRRVD